MIKNSVVVVKNYCKIYWEISEDATTNDFTLLVFIFTNPRLISPYTTDEVIANIKKEVDIKKLYIITKGLTELENKSKRFTKIIEEESQKFYKSKRNKFKKKIEFREKVTTSQFTFFKLYMKKGFIYEMVYNYDRAFDNYHLAYYNYMSSIKELLKHFNTWEVKAVSDALYTKLIRKYIKLGNSVTLSRFFFLQICHRVS